jgi:iron complex outermembrane recepter protein
VVNYDLGWATVTSATSYATLKENLVNDLTDTYEPALAAALHIPGIGVAFAAPIDQKKFTEELRVASRSDQRIEWLGGFFFTRESSTHVERFDPFFIATGAAFPVNLLSGALISRYTEYAGFGDVTVHVTSKFDVQGGVRYGSNDQHYSQPESGALIGATTTLRAHSSDDSTTFLVTPRYRFDENAMVYARVASGYRPGGPNPLTPAQQAAGVPGAFKPDTLINYEVGYKASLMDRRLTLDLAVFHLDWRHIQVQTVFSGFDATGNAGSARSDGVEASATFTPLRGLTFNGNMAYTDAHLTAEAEGVSAKSGDPLPNVPKWAGHLSGDYNFPIAAAWDGFVGAGVRYMGERTSGFVSKAPAGFSRPKIPAYTTVDLRAGLVHGGWTLEVFAKNVGDERGFNNLSSLAYNGRSNPYEASLIQPRTIGLSLSASY